MATVCSDESQLLKLVLCSHMTLHKDYRWIVRVEAEQRIKEAGKIALSHLCSVDIGAL